MRKSLRIKDAREFQSIIGKRHFFTNKCFVLYHVKRTSDHTRVGITVSKKLGNAVERNKIKRQCRMMMQELLTFDEGFDLICIIRGGYLVQSYLQNKKELETLLKKIKIYYDAQSMKEIKDERI
jgi:ribonuclease P protein component